MADHDSTCWTLVRGAATGDPDDQEAFAERYSPVLRAYLAARWHAPIDHDEVVDGAQEVFLQCFKEGGALGRVEPDRPGGFRAFLYGIARNVAGTLESRRTRNREKQPHSGFHPEDVERTEHSLSQVFDRAWAELVTREARGVMARHAGRSRTATLRFQALELRYQKALPAREIAVSLDLETKDLYPMLTRARKEFRAALLEVMAGYHPLATREDLEQECLDLLSKL